MQKKTKKAQIFLVLSVGLLLLVTACSKNKDHPGESASQTGKYVTQGAQVAYLKGKVIQTIDSGGYTYVLLDRNGAQLWVAMPVTKVSAGDEVSIVPGVEMRNFTSNTLKRTFDRIIFSSGMAPKEGGAVNAQASSMLSSRPYGEIEKKNVNVEKAHDPNGYTVSEIYEKRAALNGKPVVVKGSVVKVSTGIMGKNGIHLQDGSGAQEKDDFDITVTSQDQPVAGDVVVARGTLFVDKDFGAGYRYTAIIEDAKIQKD